MRRFDQSLLVLASCLFTSLAGCVALDQPAASGVHQPAAQVAPIDRSTAPPLGAIQPASARTETVSGPDHAAVLDASAAPEHTAPRLLPDASQAPSLACPFGDKSELLVEDLVREVLARNPSLAQMVAAYQAAASRFPQVTSLDDPMLGVSTAPGAWGSNTVDGGYRLDIAQRYPWPGKLGLRGANAAAEANAAGQDVDDTRLQLVESAKSAFYDYYLVGRAITVNEEGLRLLREFRQNAETRYATGLVPQQDVLQADVEIGRQRERLLTLERMRKVAIARINTLMHLAPDAPLPPPPKEIKVHDGLPDAPSLRAAALGRRPDLLAVSSRLAAEQASLALAEKEYKPDAEFTAAYDAFWQERPLRTMLGVRLNLPVRLARRDAAVAEARAKVAQRQAEFARLTDQVNFDVQQSFEQVREGEQVVRLYEETILPAAETNVKAAQSTYVTGRIPFLSLIEAQRNVIGLRDRYYEALAEYFRRRATLERATGGLLTAPLLADTVPACLPQ
jgi:outer membrane protein TolC